MKFYLCSLSLCLLLVLAIFPSSDGQFGQQKFQAGGRQPQNMGQGPNRLQRPNQRPNQRLNQRPNHMPNQRPNQRPNQMLNQRPNQMLNQRPNQMQNNMGGTCQLKGQSFRVGAKIISNCQLCTCLQNGQTPCNPLTCMHCNSYLTLQSNTCCIRKCGNMRMQPADFNFEEGIFGEDRKIAAPHYQGFSDNPDESLA